MTTVQLSLIISSLALIIAGWARYEGFITTRRSRIVDRLKRIGECIEMATEMNCKAEDFERLLMKVKPNSPSMNSDIMRLSNWEETMNTIENVKKVTQAFIDSAYQDLENFKKRKRVKLSQIEIEAFLAEFQGIKTHHKYLFTSFENIILEYEIQLAENEELKSKIQMLHEKKKELEVEHQMLLDKKDQQEAVFEKLKKTNDGI